MLIVPYIHKITHEKNMDVHNIKILTISGKELWEEPNTNNIDSEILNPNDIYCTNNTIKIDQNTYLCEVDIDKTNINDLYKWKEIDMNDTTTFCWKDYAYFMGKNDESWLNIPRDEYIHNISLETLILSIIKKDKHKSSKP